MCTLSLLRHDNTLHLIMNRDEERQRKEAGLYIGQTETLDYCYPVDAESVGTWFGVNSRGIALALLNRYQTPVIEQAVSRGTIIPAALAYKNFDDIVAYLRALNTRVYNGFDCIVVSNKQAFRFSWDGYSYREYLLTINDGLLFTSSSERLEQVSEYRHCLFVATEKTPAAVASFHLTQHDGHAASAVLMSRVPTHTKSIVTLSLSETDSCLRYYDQTQLQPNRCISQLNPSGQWHSKTGV